MKRLSAFFAVAALVLGACSSRIVDRPEASPAPKTTTVESPTPSVSPTPSPSSPAGLEDPDLVVAVKGDWGAGTPAQRAITARMCAVRKLVPFRYVLTTGDNFYDPDGVATERNYRAPERCLYSAPDHEWRATWGNHDSGRPSTGEVLGAERWYAWSAAGVDFFALDSNQPNNSTQRRWLERALRASSARVKIAYFHHPPFTVGGVHRPNETVQRNWVPLFERYGVSLVLSGHEHVYEHHRVKGVDYVVTGGGGAVTYGCVRQASYKIKCVSAHHFALLAVQGDQITVTAIKPSGEVLDRFTITSDS